MESGIRMKLPFRKGQYLKKLYKNFVSNLYKSKHYELDFKNLLKLFFLVYK